MDKSCIPFISLFFKVFCLRHSLAAAERTVAANTRVAVRSPGAPRARATKNVKKNPEEKGQWTIYSATTFLESCRKVVREKWFEKSGSRNLVREKWLTRKKGGFIL